jgi:hypothetical protein
MKKQDYLKALNFLSESSLYFLGEAAEEELYSYVVDRLHHLTGARVVANEYLPEINSTKVKEIKFSVADLTKFERIVGQKMIGLTLEVDKATRKRFISGKLDKVDGIYELSFYKIPKQASLMIEKVLNIGEIYAMAFVVEEDFLGTVVILCHRGEGLKSPEIVEAFVNQAAVALKRKRIERKLAEANERLKKEQKRLIESEQKKDDFFLGLPAMS